MANVFLYGGCVIRDAYQSISGQVGSSGYIARQSLISAINPPVDIPPVNIGSAFQSRMLNGDIQSSLLHTLRRAAAETDLLVIDLHVDRSGIYRTNRGAFLTPSQELTDSGLLSSVNATRIELGSERHTKMWTTAATRFAGRLDEFGLLPKTLVIDAPWMESDETGRPFEDFNGRPIREVSDDISALTEVLGGFGVKVARMPSEVASSPVKHRWGSGPYHFGDAAMDWVSKQILQAVT